MVRRCTFELSVSKTTKSSDHNSPWSCCVAHHAYEEIPEFLQSRSPHGYNSPLTAERDVDIDAGRFEQFAAWIRTGSKQPALISTEAVRAQQHSWSIHWIKQQRTHSSWRSQHERRTRKNGAATTVTTAGRPHLLCWWWRTKTSQRSTRQCQRQGTTAAWIDGKTQVFEKLRPAAKWNEVSNCLLRYNL